jgi:glycosyltransferase XagB
LRFLSEILQCCQICSPVMPHAVQRRFDQSATELIGLERFRAPGDRFDLDVAKLLLARKLVSLTGLAIALRQRAETGASLAETLLSSSVVTPADYYRAVADAYGRPFVDLQRQPVDPALTSPGTHADYAKRAMVPWQMHDGRLVIATSSISREHVEWADARFGAEGYDFVIAAPAPAQGSTQA